MSRLIYDRREKRGSATVPSYTDIEFREYVCRLVVDDGKVVAELSRELDIAKSTIFRWLRTYKEKIGWYEQNARPDKPQESLYQTSTDVKNQLRARDREIQRLQEENAILKKAMHVFTQAPD